MNEEAQKQFKAIIEQMALVYKHDSRPWMIGYSGGKDSTLLCQLTFEMLESLAPEERKKKVYIVTSDTMVENPVVPTEKWCGISYEKWRIWSWAVHARNP